MNTMKRPGKEFFEVGCNRENNQLDYGERNGKGCRKAIVEEDHNRKNELENDVSNRRKTPRKEIARGSSGIVGVREESFRDVQIACSAKGEVNISLNCRSAVFDGKTFCMPSIEEVCKLVEGRRLALAKRIKPDLSFMSLLTEMCECALELGSKPEGGNKWEQLGMVPEQKIAPKREDNLRLKPRVGERNGNGQSKKKLKRSVPEPASTNSNSLSGGSAATN
ncbi:uncharacterized protein LOC109828699 [Asparagus officinalis]|uniref:uncharacterized protein LOC109828699 n=1 Tax=Asparagus officinalis TaxID=4686 RepID=UPI00098DF30B|nr:uncharacterized protein LOC109828699 [Asparagus officinalis]